MPNGRAFKTDVSFLEKLAIGACGTKNVSQEIRAEAARALAKISENNTEKVLEQFASADEITRPGIAWALSKRGRLDIRKIIDIVPLDSIDTRQWVAFMLGYAEHNQLIGKIEDLKNIDSELYFAVTLLWKIISSWVYNLEEV
ncbi:MAG: hypothetical protein AB1611_20355 [bacterium]